MDTRVDNQWVVTGEVSGGVEVRHTPAGVPVSRFRLQHRSRQWEAGSERDVVCTVHVVAFGADSRQALTGVVDGERVRVTGFAAQTSYRRPNSLTLHAQRIERLGPSPRSDRNATGE